MKRNTTPCPRNCGRVAQVNIRFGILPCGQCQLEDRRTKIKHQPEFATMSQASRVQADRDKNAKDVIQPWSGKGNKPNPDFVKAYPEHASSYFNNEQLRQL